MGPKHNLVHFKSLFGCLLIKSWSSSQHLYARKNIKGNPISTFPPCFYFASVKWFRFGWQDWWGHSGISLICNKNRPSKCPKFNTNRNLGKPNLCKKVRKFCQNTNRDKIQIVTKYVFNQIYLSSSVFNIRLCKTAK